MRTVAVADIEVTVRGKRDISGDKINRTLAVGDIFSWIAVSPQCLAVRRCFDDLALVDVAVIKDFLALLAAETESVRATTKFFAKRAHKAASRVINHDSLSPHAGLVDGVRHVNKSLLILRKVPSDLNPLYPSIRPPTPAIAYGARCTFGQQRSSG